MHTKSDRCGEIQTDAPVLMMTFGLIIELERQSGVSIVEIIARCRCHWRRRVNFKTHLECHGDGLHKLLMELQELTWIMCREKKVENPFPVVDDDRIDY
jgi:hypothetical protein